MSTRRTLAALVALSALCGLAPARLRAETPPPTICVAVEIRVITLSEACFERRDAAHDGPDLPALGAEPVFLDDGQVRRLLEAVQGDRRSSILMAPKLVAPSGQTAVVDVGQQEDFVTGVETVAGGDGVRCRPQTRTVRTGTRLSVIPAVSADRRYVAIDLRASLSRLALPVPTRSVVVTLPASGTGQAVKPATVSQEIQTPTVNVQELHSVATVPDGGTVLLGGLKTMREVRTEYGPPVVSQIPYLNRLFRTVGYGRESENLVILVTPRVVVVEDEAAGADAPEQP